VVTQNKEVSFEFDVTGDPPHGRVIPLQVVTTYTALDGSRRVRVSTRRLPIREGPAGTPARPHLLESHVLRRCGNLARDGKYESAMRVLCDWGSVVPGLQEALTAPPPTPIQSPSPLGFMGGAGTMRGLGMTRSISGGIRSVAMTPAPTYDPKDFKSTVRHLSAMLQNAVTTDGGASAVERKRTRGGDDLTSSMLYTTLRATSHGMTR
jgi:hypothetical protein